MSIRGIKEVEYRVISDVDGWVTDRDTREEAEERAAELDEEYPGQSHHVEEVSV